MKRAQLLLTITIFLAIAGSALAFKIKRASDFIYVVDPITGACTVKVFGATTRPGGAFITIRSATTVLGAPCVLQSVYIGL